MSFLQPFYQALTTQSSISEFVSDDVSFNVSYPINELNGTDEIQSKYWSLLQRSLTNIERKAFIEYESEYQGNRWIAATGYFIGAFDKDLLTIPATGKTLYLRFTELVKLDQNRKICEYFQILDFLDVMNQAGVNPLRKSLGHDGLIMPPSTMDGLNPDNAQDSSEADKTETLVMGMLNELGRFDGKSLESMKLGNFWHPDFMWYGPAGIGTTHGISGFRKHHQGPFVFSFPDRVVDHKATIVKKGNYVATGGWPHMHGSHLVGGWLGLPPCGKKLELRVMDIWRREGELLKENWVAIDIIHMCHQMGLDVFEMMRLSNNIKTVSFD